ncbi:MAG: DNA mismatch repair endonuclease MutL [Candidatus Dadabacteria bacterium]|nr:DNA mismatch repair endonuclease MutL [Candidatus Dadabacteria bacterium]
MSKIRKLSPETTGKIAAGEVIERPASAVKELVENSIDASSTRISVEIVEGGKALIRVSDNGTGIRYEELPCAVENYSTSKVVSIEDVMKVRTLGFRGEALASIRSVAKLAISSRSVDEEVGREMHWAGERVMRDTPSARTPGTDIAASEIFFNLPARRKFLSADVSELRKITMLVQSFALSFPEISFSLKNDGREVLHYPASSSEERMEAVFGRAIYSGMRNFSGRDSGTAVSGYTSMPTVTRGNRSMQFVFVNRRQIRDRSIAHAISHAYQSIIPGDRFPITVLFIEIPPDEIDVNVHPAKSEIRFRDERSVHRIVSSSIRGVLSGKTVSFSEKVETVYKAIFPEGKDSPARSNIKPDLIPPGIESARDSAVPHAAEHRSDWLFQESPHSLFGGGEHETPSASKSGRLYWQLHQSYIFIQIRGGLVIIDQHAAHERILYDGIKKALSGRRPSIQSLLFPATLELTPDEFENYESVADLLPSMGFEVEPFGFRSIIVRAIPSGTKNWNDGRLLQDILGEKGLGKSGVEMMMKSYSCRAAVKAGEKLSEEEMESLSDQLFATEFPFTCPHGRPTMLRVDLDDLERRFQRTVTKEK